MSCVRRQFSQIFYTKRRSRRLRIRISRKSRSGKRLRGRIGFSAAMHHSFRCAVKHIGMSIVAKLLISRYEGVMHDMIVTFIWKLHCASDLHLDMSRKPICHATVLKTIRKLFPELTGWCPGPKFVLNARRVAYSYSALTWTMSMFDISKFPLFLERAISIMVERRLSADGKSSVEYRESRSLPQK